MNVIFQRTRKWMKNFLVLLRTLTIAENIAHIIYYKLRNTHNHRISNNSSFMFISVPHKIGRIYLTTNYPFHSILSYTKTESNLRLNSHAYIRLLAICVQQIPNTYSYIVVSTKLSLNCCVKHWFVSLTSSHSQSLTCIGHVS